MFHGRVLYKEHGCFHDGGHTAFIIGAQQVKPLAVITPLLI